MQAQRSARRSLLWSLPVHPAPLHMTIADPKETLHYEFSR